MKIDFEHLGSIEQGSITLNDFTVFCGKNNSGKTYAMYSIYGLVTQNYNLNFDFVKLIISKVREDGCYRSDTPKFIAENLVEMIRHIEEQFKDYLPSLFGVSDNEFTNTKIKIHLNFNEDMQKIFSRGLIFTFESTSAKRDKNFISLKVSSEIELDFSGYEIENNALLANISAILATVIIFNNLLSTDYFLLPAERAGINIFYKELFSIRNLLLQESQNNNVNPMRLLKDVLQARYAEPIKDYLQFLNNISSTKNDKSSYIEYAEIIQKNIVKGKYEVDDFGNVSFTPSSSENKLPLHFSSSTVKTLFGLVFYLEHLAKEGDYLMIDEPELNLHPDNQRQVARVLAQLVNAGLKVIVSTHSDYFIRELNNLIMLKKDFSGVKELQKKYGYQDNELLDGKQISAYLFDNNKIMPMPLDEDEGIIAETFDSVINNLNKSSNEIYYAMQDAKEEID